MEARGGELVAVLATKSKFQLMSTIQFHAYYTILFYTNSVLIVLLYSITTSVPETKPCFSFPVKKQSSTFP